MRAIPPALVALLTTSVASAQTPPQDNPLPALPSAQAPQAPPPAPLPSAAPAAKPEPGSAPAPEAPAPTVSWREAAPAPASAPTPPPPCVAPALVHQGFYFGIGSGIGEVGAWGNGPFGSASISGFGSSASIAVGGSPVRGLAIAGVIQGDSRSGSTFNGGPQVTATTTTVVNGQMMPTSGPLSGHASASLFLLGGQVDWFPVPEGGWHTGGAIGLGGVTVTDDAGNTIAGVSVAASLFGGYQWWLGPGWSLGISGIVTGAPSLKMNDSNGNDSGYNLMPLSVGIESVLLHY